MMPEEKQQLLDLLDHERKWCKNVEARDARGNPVRCNNEKAAAWDVTGAVYRLFGWERAIVLYPQIDKHLHGKRRVHGLPPRSTALDAMAALQEFNDNAETTFEVLRSRLESMPVWTGEKRSTGATSP